jgi:hypothetical protein
MHEQESREKPDNREATAPGREGPKTEGRTEPLQDVEGYSLDVLHALDT